MTWSYIPFGKPGHSDRDKVRVLVGDTCENEPLVEDDVFDFALSEYPSSLRFAAAVVLRSLAARFARQVSVSVGDVHCTNVAARAKGFRDLADDYDPDGMTREVALVNPRFGGLSIAEKEALAENEDAVQPSFYRGQNDIPGGPDDEDIQDDILGRRF